MIRANVYPAIDEGSELNYVGLRSDEASGRRLVIWLTKTDDETDALDRSARHKLPVVRNAKPYRYGGKS